jgi:signal transduction histidine kinase
MRKRLVASYIGLVIVVLVMLEVPLGFLAAHHERGQTLDQVQRDAASLAVLAGEALETGHPSELGALAERYREQTGGEVTVLDSTRGVVATSESDNDHDATGKGASLVSAALEGRGVATFGQDEGRPWATAAAPILSDNSPAGAVYIGVPADATEDRIRTVWLALALFALGTIALTAVLAILLSRSLTRPLARLEHAVDGLAAGRLETRADEGAGPPEIRTLATQINSMAARLMDLMDAQNRFVADASHQLRSPLTALRLRLENLEADAGDGDAGEPLGSDIAAAGREVGRLTRIVDGLLALGRAGAAPPEKTPVDAAAVVTERCESWGALADERGVRLVPRISTDRPTTVMLVGGDLEQILDNLIANAMDAVAAGGMVRVTAGGGEGGVVELHVIDNGPGMRDEDRARAFDRFWRGAASGPGRSGLGLAIVAQLAIRNDAKVELRQADPVGLDAVVTIAPSARVSVPQGSTPDAARGTEILDEEVPTAAG